MSGSIIKPCIALALLCCPLLAHAIELGEPQVDSWLGERLEVLVPVELGGLEPRRVQARLLSASEYEELQLAPAHPFLKHLTAGWSDAAGPLTIQIRSQRPNPEPLLTIAVEVVTPSLRVIRHVSLLFDPRPTAATTADRPQVPTPASGNESAPKSTAKPKTAAEQPRAVAPVRATAPKPSTNRVVAAQPAAVTLPRFQLTYSLREIPPLQVTERPTTASLGGMSTALASTSTQHTEHAATSAPTPPPTTLVQARPQIHQAAPAARAEGVTAAIESHENKSLRDVSAPETPAGQPLLIGRVLWALLPIVLAAALWMLLWQRVRPTAAHRGHASAAPSSETTKVTPIHAGRPVPGSAAPILRVANE